MNAAPEACLCPLLVDKENLKGDDRRCHIPTTRIVYLGTNPNGKCHDETDCLACKSLPRKARQEVLLREKLRQRAAAAKRTATTRNRIRKLKEEQNQPLTVL